MLASKSTPRPCGLSRAALLLTAGLLALFSWSSPLPAKEAPAAPAEAAAGCKEPAPETAAEEIMKAPEVVTTQHTLEIGGKTIAYTARTGKLALKDREGKATAEVFFIAYTKDGEDPENRPLTFSFNGGPGSSSVWLHMGVLGPRRVQLSEEGFALPPPHQLVDNSYSILDETDLVFIDPVSTGYSRPVDFEKEKEFHGLEEDVASVGDFIRRYVTEFARWSSPKFLIGESYGTTRAAALSLHLQSRYGLYLNGIMLVSAVLDFSTIRYAEGNDLPYILFLPTLAASAWYHQRLPEALQALPLQDFLRQVEPFATGAYRDALFAGDSLPGAEARAIAATLASYTGIPAAEFLKQRLRLDAFTFFDKLLEDKQQRVGRFDSRYIGTAPYSWEEHGQDPSYTQIYGAYSSGFNDYVRRSLGYESDLPYEILTSVWPWNFGDEFKTRYVNVSERLRQALVMNPFLQVHVCCGYYDVATPYFAAEYTLDRLLLHPDLRANVSVSYYAGGHMMYTIEKELARQKEILAAFIRSVPRAAAQ